MLNKETNVTHRPFHSNRPPELSRCPTPGARRTKSKGHGLRIAKSGFGSTEVLKGDGEEWIGSFMFMYVVNILPFSYIWIIIPLGNACKPTNVI